MPESPCSRQRTPILRMRIAVWAGALLLVLSAACDGEGAAASDDWGLASVDLAEMTVDDVVAVFDAMPAGLAGNARVSREPSERGVEYDGAGLGVFLQSGEGRLVGGEVLTPAEFLTAMAESGDYEIIGSALEDDVVWLGASLVEEGRSGYFLGWAEGRGEYLLWFTADNRADLDRLIEAFLEAAGR